MSEVKQIFTSGKMNKDLDERIIPNGEYRDALNLNSTTSEGENVGSMQNLLGNEMVHNVSSGLSNAVSIGSIKSDIDNKLYWFVTSDTLDGIYEYNQKTDKVSPILIDQKDTISASLYDISVSSNDDYNLIIEKGFIKDDVEQIIGNVIDDSTAGAQTEVRNSISLYNDRYSINLDIPKNTVIEFSKDGDLIFHDINYSGSDFTSITLGVTYNYNNVLNFDSDKFITGINIIDGLLFWTDDFNQPRKLNINKFRKYSNDNFQETTKINNKDFVERQISVAKMAPISAPSFELYESVYGGGNLVANKTINFFNKDAVGDTAETDIELTNISSDISWQKNDLIKATAPNDLGEAPEVDLKVVNIVDPADSTITERSKMTSKSLTFTLRIVSIELNENDTSYVFDLESQEGKSLYELKFPTFSYRWRYKDGEYSVFAPFSETAFLPGKFKYNIETGYNEAMENNAQLVALSDIEIGHDDVEEIDVIYKDSRNSNVYTIDTIKRTNVSGVLFDGTYKINKEKIDAVIESNQLLRQWDNVPRKAKAQEITGNRLVFGNYLQNYNITVPTTLDLKIDTNSQSDFRSIKSNRSYQVGVVFIDEFNRQSPVQTASADEASSTLVIDGNRSSLNNSISAKVTSPAPAWAKHFKYFIKETSMEYYNLALDNIYQERNDTGFVWLSFSSNDINKIRPDKLVDDFVVLKKEHSTNVAVPYSKEARFKVLDIKRDPPAFLSEKYNMSTQLNKIIFAQSPPPPMGSVGGYVIRQTTAKVNGTPVAGGTKFAIRGSDDNETNGDGVAPSKLVQAVNGKPLIKAGMFIEFSRPGYDNRVTNKYRIKKTVFEGDINSTSDDTEIGIEIDGSFGNDVNILYQNDNVSSNDKLHHLASNSNFQTAGNNDEGETDITMTVYEKEKDAELDAKFSGRFFVKVRNQATVEKHLMEAMISADVSNYITDSVVDVYGKDKSPNNKKCKESRDSGGKSRLNRSSWFIKEGGEAGTGSVQFGSDVYNFHVIGSTCIADERVFGGLKAGDKIKFTKDSNILYEVTKVATDYKSLRYMSDKTLRKMSNVDTLNCWFSVKPYNNDTKKQGLVNTIIQKGDDGFITIQKLRLDAETFDFKSANPAVFETEPRESPTELDIYYETQDAYSVNEIGNEQKLRWYNCFTFNGVESNRIRDDYNNPTIAKGVRVSTTLAEKYKEERVFNGLIHSGIINSKNSVNRSNEFIQAEAITKNLLPSFGSIQKLHARDNDVVVFCENKVVKVLSDKDILFNADGSGNVRAARTPLGTTVAYKGEFGIGKNPESFASFGYRSYFTDAPRGNVLRLSGDGIERISRYGMVDFWQNAFVNHSRFIGSYDEANNLYNLSVPCLHTTCFDDAVNGWTTRKSWVPECGISLNNNFYTYRTGDLWVHDSENVKRNNFYGDQYISSLQCTMNESPSIIKRFRTLGYEGSSDWKGKVVTDQNKSSVISFTDKENKYFAYLKGEAKTLATLNEKNFSVQGLGIGNNIELTDSAPSSNTKKSIKVIIQPKTIPGINCGQTKITDKGLPFIEKTIQADTSLPDEEIVLEYPVEDGNTLDEFSTNIGTNIIQDNKGKIKLKTSELLKELDKAENLDDVDNGFVNTGDILLKNLESSTGDGTIAKVDEGVGNSVTIQADAKTKEDEFTVSGTPSTSITNATIQTSLTSYTEKGPRNKYELIQTRTITPNANYVIDTSKITVNNTRIKLKTKDNGNGTVDLEEWVLIEDKNETGVNYTISFTADPVVVADPNLYNFYTNKTSISNQGEKVTINLFGDINAAGSIIISNASNVQLEKIDFKLKSTNLDLYYDFPSSNVSTTYTVTLDADSGTKLTDVSLETPITIVQNVDTLATIQYSANSVDYEGDITYTAGNKNLQVITGLVGKSLPAIQTISWSIAPPSGKQWTIIKDVEETDFITESGANNNIRYQNITTSLNGSSPNPLEITASIYLDEFIGDQNLILNLDSIVGISTTVTFAYTVPGSSNYTASSNVVLTGLSGTSVNDVSQNQISFELTPSSNYDFSIISNPSTYLKANFELKESSTVVTDTYVDVFTYNINNSGKFIISFMLKNGLIFPTANKTINLSIISGSSFAPANVTKTGTNYTINLIDSSGKAFNNTKILYQKGGLSIYRANVPGQVNTAQSKTVNLGGVVKPGFTFSGTSSPSVASSVTNVTDSSKAVSINTDGELELATTFTPTAVNPSITYTITAAEQVRNYIKIPVSSQVNTIEAAKLLSSSSNTFTYTNGDPDNLKIGDEFQVLFRKVGSSQFYLQETITPNTNIVKASILTGFAKYNMANDDYVIGYSKGVIDFIEKIAKAPPIPQPPTIDSPLTITKNTLTDYSVTFNVGDYGISKAGLSAYVVYSSLFSEKFIPEKGESVRRTKFEQLADFTGHNKSTDKNNKAIYNTIENLYVVGPVTNKSIKRNLLKGSQTLNVLKPKISSLYIPNNGFKIDANGFRMKYQPEIYGRVYLRNKDGAWMWSEQFKVPEVLDKKISELKHSDATVQFNNRVNSDNTISALIKVTLQECDPGENVYLGIAINKASSSTPMETITNQTFKDNNFTGAGKDYNVYIWPHVANPPLSYDTPTTWTNTGQVANNDVLPFAAAPNKYENLKTQVIPSSSNPTRWKDGVEYAWHIGHAKNMNFALSGGADEGQINGFEPGVVYNYRVFAYRGTPSMINQNNVVAANWLKTRSDYNTMKLGYKDGQDPSTNTKLGSGVGGYGVFTKDNAIRGLGFEKAEVVSLHGGSFTPPSAFEPNINLSVPFSTDGLHASYADLTATLTSTGMFGIQEAGIIITAGETNLLSNPSDAKSVRLGSTKGLVSKYYSNAEIEFVFGKTHKIPFFQDTDVSSLAASSGLNLSETNPFPYVESFGGGGLPSNTTFWVNWYVKDKFGTYKSGDTPITFKTSLGKGYEHRNVYKGSSTFANTSTGVANIPDVCCPSQAGNKIFTSDVILDNSIDFKSTVLMKRVANRNFKAFPETTSVYFRKKTSGNYFYWDATDKKLTRGKCPKCPTSTNLGLSATPNNVPLTQAPSVQVPTKLSTSGFTAVTKKIDGLYQMCTEWDNSKSNAQNMLGKRYWVRLKKTGTAHNVGQELTVKNIDGNGSNKTVKVGVNNTLSYGKLSGAYRDPGTSLVPFVYPYLSLMKGALPIPYGKEHEKHATRLTQINSTFDKGFWHDALASPQEHYHRYIRPQLDFVSEKSETSRYTNNNWKDLQFSRVRDNIFGPGKNGWKTTRVGSIHFYQNQFLMKVTANSSVLATASNYSQPPTLNTLSYEEEFIGDNQFIIGADNTTNLQTKDYPELPQKNRYSYTKNPLEVFRPDGSIYLFQNPTQDYPSSAEDTRLNNISYDYTRYVDSPIIWTQTAANEVLNGGNIRRAKLALINDGHISGKPTMFEILLGSGYVPNDLTGTLIQSIGLGRAEYSSNGISANNSLLNNPDNTMNFAVAENAGPLFLYRFDDLLDNYPMRPGLGHQGKNDSEISIVERAQHIGMKKKIYGNSGAGRRPWYGFNSSSFIGDLSLNHLNQRYEAFYDTANQRWYGVGTHVYSSDDLLTAGFKGFSNSSKNNIFGDHNHNVYRIPRFTRSASGGSGSWDTPPQDIVKLGF